MTQILQSIYSNIPSASQVRDYLSNTIRSTTFDTTFDFCVTTIAQIALKPSIFLINPIRSLIDISVMQILKPIIRFGLRIFPTDAPMAGLFSCCYAATFIGAYRFVTDSSYTLIDMIALASTSIKYGVPLLETSLSALNKRWQNRKLLEACQKGDLEKAKDAIRKGANPSTITREGFSYVSEALTSGNQELILLMLEKTQSFDLFWNTVLGQIEIQQDRYYLDSNDMFNTSGHYGDFFYDLNKFEATHIFYLFKEDNIQLFKELWKHIPSDVEIRKNEILKLALRCGSAEISKFLMGEGARVPELEQIKDKHKLNISNFLPIFILSINGLAGFTELGQKNLFEVYFNLTQITSDSDLQDRTGINYLALLNELETNKCTLWEMAIYLSLIGEKENLREEDQCGLRPLDYAILYHKNLGSAFFNFLIRQDKSLITLGTHHTCFHLAIQAHRFDILLKLIKTVNESVFPSRKKTSLIFRDLWGKNVQRQLPWVRIELLNRADAFGLTPLHYSLMDLSLSLAHIDVLLKAGAKDIPGSFIQDENEGSPIPSYSKKTALEMLPHGEFEFVLLTGSEFIQKAKQIYNNRGEKELENLFDKYLQLLNGEKTYEELASAE